MIFKSTLFIVPLFLSCQLISLSALEVITDNYPPLSYEDPKNPERAIGVCTTMVEEIQRRTGDASAIEIWPWDEAFAYTKKTKDVALYITTFTKEREDQFFWVGPLVHNRWCLYARSDSDIALKNLEEAKKYKIGTVRDYAVDALLRKHGFDHQLTALPDDRLNVPRLMKGKIDLWAGGEAQLPYKARQAGYKTDDIKPVLVMQIIKMYIVFNKQSDPKLVQRWRDAWSAMLQDGSYEKILRDAGQMAVSVLPEPKEAD